MELFNRCSIYPFFWKSLLVSIFIVLVGLLYRYLNQIVVLTLNVSHVCMNPTESKLKNVNCETDYYKKMISIGSYPFENALTLIRENKSFFNLSRTIDLVMFPLVLIGCFQVIGQYPQYETIISIIMVCVMIRLMINFQMPTQAFLFQEIDQGSENWVKLKNTFIDSQKSDWRYILSEPQGKFNAQVCTFYRKSVFGELFNQYHGDFGWDGDGRPWSILNFKKGTLFNAHFPQPKVAKKKLMKEGKTDIDNSMFMKAFGEHLQDRISKNSDMSSLMRLTIHPDMEPNNPTSAHGSGKELERNGIKSKEATIEQRLKCCRIFGSNKRGGIVVTGSGFSHMFKPEILSYWCLGSTYSDHFAVRRTFSKHQSTPEFSYLIAGIDTNIGTGILEGGLAGVYFDQYIDIRLLLPSVR